MRHLSERMVNRHSALVYLVEAQVLNICSEGTVQNTKYLNKNKNSFQKIKYKYK